MGVSRFPGFSFPSAGWAGRQPPRRPRRCHGNPRAGRPPQAQRLPGVSGRAWGRRRGGEAEAAAAGGGIVDMRGASPPRRGCEGGQRRAWGGSGAGHTSGSCAGVQMFGGGRRGEGSRHRRAAGRGEAGKRPPSRLPGERVVMVEIPPSRSGKPRGWGAGGFLTPRRHFLWHGETQRRRRVGASGLALPREGRCPPRREGRREKRGPARWPWAPSPGRERPLPRSRRCHLGCRGGGLLLGLGDDFKKNQ